MSAKIKNAFKLLLANVLVFLIVATFAEILGQIYYMSVPENRGACSIPDKVLGWKHIPNCNLVFSGGRFRREFVTPVSFNNHGFRDKYRAFPKEENTTRIAFLGDSMVEALQVPFEKTAARVLEKKLNLMDSSKNGRKFEVLNFGIGNYSLGQMFLVYKEIASKFNPDFILIFLNEYLLERTIEFQRFEKQIQSGSRKLLRPLFVFRNRDDAHAQLSNQFWNIDKSGYFKQIETEVLESTLPAKNRNWADGVKNRESGSLFKWRGFFLKDLFSYLKEDVEAYISQKPFKIVHITDNYEIKQLRLHTGLKLLDEFDKISDLDNRNIIILDSFKYYNPSKTVSFLFKQFVDFKGYDYINLSRTFLEAEQNGLRIRWKGDSHFNEKGQIIFGEALFDFFQKKLSNGGPVSNKTG